MSYSPFTATIRIYKGTTFGFQFNFQENGSALDLTTLDDIEVELANNADVIFAHSVSDGDLTISGAEDNQLVGVADAGTMDIAKRYYNLTVRFYFAGGSEEVYVAFRAIIIDADEQQSQTAHEWDISIDTDAETVSGEQLTGLTALAIQAKEDAELAYQNASRGSGLNPEYVSTVVDQKPTDYVDGTGIAFGSYPIDHGLVQKVQWDDINEEWDDFGDPVTTVANTDSFFTKKRNTVSDLEGDEPGIFEGLFSTTPTRNLLGYNSIGDGGGGQLYWDPNQDKQDHDGGTIFSPTWNNGTFGDPQDANWYSPDPTDTGAGAWVRDVEKITFRMAGAVGDGVTDDINALQAAIDTGLEIEGTDSDQYRITSGLTHDGNISITSNGQFEIHPTSNFAAITLDNAVKISTTLASDATAGDYEVAVSDASFIEEGDIVILHSDELWYYENRGNLFKGETSVVSSVNGTTVGLKYSIYDTYDISAENVDVRVYSSKRFKLEKFDVIYPFETNTHGLQIENYKKSNINAVSLRNCYDTGIRLFGCVDCIIDDYEGYKINGANEAYGIITAGSLNCQIENSYFYNCRAPIDFSANINYGPSRNCWGVNNTIDGSGSNINGDDFTAGWSGHRGLGTHGPAEYCYFIDNTVKNVRIAFYSRGKNIVYHNNELINIASTICRATFGTNLTVEDNRIIDIDFPNKTTPIGIVQKPVGVFLEDTYLNNDGFTKIQDNNFQLQNYLVQINADAENLYINGNVIDITASGTANFINSSGTNTISNSSILKNHVYSIAGDSFSKLDSNITLENSVDEDIINRNRRTELITVSDDSVFTFSPKGVDGTIILSASGGTTPDNVNAILHYRSDANGVTEVSSGSSTTVTSGSTPPSGTTHADGDFTIQVSDDGNIYIENRLGGSISFYIVSLS